MLRAPEVILGIIVVGYILNDVFQSVVVPRPTPARYRLTRWIVRPGWRAWRTIGLRARSTAERERVLGIYAPLVVVVLLVLWLFGLVVGFGLIFDGLRAQLHPLVQDFPTALYFGGTSVLTIGFGDVVPVSGLTRMLALIAGGTGLGTIALAISFLFSLYGSFQRREILIVTLDARARAPPPRGHLLETMNKLRMVDDPPPLFADWGEWAAQGVESHLAYPVLAYFRSSNG